MKTWFYVWVLLTLGAPNLFAGYVLTYHIERYSSDGVKTNCVETNYIHVNKMRIEISCGSPIPRSPSKVMIFRGDQHVMWEIDMAARHYKEFNEQDVAKKRKSYSDAVRSVGGHNYKPTGQTQKVKNWTCTVYNHVFHDSLADTFCSTDADVVFKGAGEAEALKRQLLQELDPLLIDPDEQNPLADLSMGPSRFTLKHTNILLDQPTFIREFSEGHSSPLPPAVFELPKGVTPIRTSL